MAPKRYAITTRACWRRISAAIVAVVWGFALYAGYSFIAQPAGMIALHYIDFMVVTLVTSVIAALARPHWRFNPLMGGWVQVSPQRMGRPWQGEISPPDPLPPADDPACYLCPGNVRVGRGSNPANDGVYVFDNDFPALADDATGDSDNDDPLLRSAEVRKFMVGHEMLAEPQRDLTPACAAEMLLFVSGLVHYRC